MWEDIDAIAPSGSSQWLPATRSDQERKRKRVTVHISQCIHPRAQNLKGLNRGVARVQRGKPRRHAARRRGRGRLRRGESARAGPAPRFRHRAVTATEPQIKCSWAS